MHASPVLAKCARDLPDPNENGSFKNSGIDTRTRRQEMNARIKARNSAGALLALVLCGGTYAQSFPSHAVTMMVPFAFQVACFAQLPTGKAHRQPRDTALDGFTPAAYWNTG